MKINIYWFRRDLRLEDNTALEQALKEKLPVLPVFIFDSNITDELPGDDPRVNFIHEKLSDINKELKKSGGALKVFKGDPLKIWEEQLVASYDINAVFINKDYEPYALKRDNAVEALLKKRNIGFFRFKDQVIFGENEILKPDGKPYTVFTPYKKKWLSALDKEMLIPGSFEKKRIFNFLRADNKFSSLEESGFRKSQIKVRSFDLEVIKDYDKYRDIPAADRTSYLSPHLRFGTVSIRKIVAKALEENPVFLSELIWREFFMQILFHFPDVVTNNFRSIYNDISWRNNDDEFRKWCRGETGYPIVDAGMRQLNETGYMHNRVRMITAGFLCKHLLTDWRWGEAYFAEKLLDYELSSNNGNWQWAAGTGCDAAPYFRIFNPDTQQVKFDPEKEYIMKWNEGSAKTAGLPRIVDHDFARNRAIEAYKSAIRQSIFPCR
ncbi:MAG TPA: deoxyribodipyrimidine photo-lyase [Bacteroidales bacterium]|nr:deoxyribodipyrimidine photo-lyase [Bacteroidales bacterium]